MAIAAGRLGPRSRASSHGGTSCRPTRCRTGRRPERCTTPATTRRASTARSSSRGTTSSATGSRPRGPRGGSRGSGSPASSSRRSRTWATSRSPRRRSSEPGSAPKSGNAEGASLAVDPLGGITVRLGTTPQGQGHRTVCAQVVADELGCAPEDVTVLSELDTQTTPWTVASGNYSSRFSGVGVGAVQLAARRIRAKVDAIRAHVGDTELSLRRVAGMAHWNPEGLPDGHGAGARRGRVLGGAEPRPSGRRGSRRVVRRARASSSTSARSRSTPRRAPSR